MANDLWQLYISSLPLLLKGCVITIYVSLIGIFCGLFFGILVGIFDCQKLKMRYVSPFFRIYITIFRGTPLFVQIFIWYFVWFPILINPTDGLLISGDAAMELRRNYGALIAGTLALSVNAGAYITEIFRAGIQSIDRGQVEAARSLGLSYPQAMRHIILPQAVRRMLPPFGNEFITLLKDSSLVSAIAVAELAFVARSVAGRYSVYEEPYYTIALIYLVMTMGLSWLFSWLEKRYNTGYER